MKSRARRTARLAAALAAAGLLLGGPAAADEPGAVPGAPAVHQEAPAPPARPLSPSEPDGDGIDVRRLPLDARDDLIDHAGRDLPGAMFSSDGRLVIGGGRPQDTVVRVDGFRVHRLTLPVAALARVELLSAGYGLELGDVLGGSLDLTTRTAGNRPQASVDLARDFYDHAVTLVSPTVAVPLWRDRLFLLAAGRLVDTRDRDIPGYFQNAPGETSRALGGALKLAWLPAAGHVIDSLSWVDRRRADNGERMASPEAQPAHDDDVLFTSLRWRGTLGPRLTARAQIGYEQVDSAEKPELCRTSPDSCLDLAPRLTSSYEPFTSQNWKRDERQHTRGLEALVAFSAGWDGGWIQQRFQLSTRARRRSFRFREGVPGNEFYEVDGNFPRAHTTTFSEDPRGGVPQPGMAWFEGSALQTEHALEDEVRLFGRLWLTPGVGLVTGHARTERSLALDRAGLTLQLRAAWDATGDGRTWVRASSHRRVSGDLEDVARFSLGTQARRRCEWDDVTQAYTRNCYDLDGGDNVTVGSPRCRPGEEGGGAAICPRSLALPHSWEHTLGLSRALGAAVTVGMDLTYRRTTELPVTTETNQIWNDSGSQSVGFLSGRPERVYDLTTDRDNARRYLAVTASAERRTGGLRFLLAYTWSRLEEDLELRTRERRHRVHVLGTYDVNGVVSLGVMYTHRSGTAAVPLPTRTGGPSFGETYKAMVGVNPGNNINDPADAPFELSLPSDDRLSLQLRWRWKQLVGIDLDMFADFLDFPDWKTARPMVAEASYPYNHPHLDRRRMRLGLEYRY